jgi:hypothetical protein
MKLAAYFNLVKNMWIHTYTPPQFFVVCCFIQHKDNIAFRHLLLERSYSGGWNGGDGQFMQNVRRPEGSLGDQGVVEHKV